MLIYLWCPIEGKDKDFSNHLFEMFLDKLEVLECELIDRSHIFHDFFFTLLALFLASVEVRDNLCLGGNHGLDRDCSLTCLRGIFCNCILF